jgi:hypothetical protein
MDSKRNIREYWRLSKNYKFEFKAINLIKVTNLKKVFYNKIIQLLTFQIVFQPINIK